MKAILTLGVSASGKTTWATEFVQNNKNWVNINRDDIRFMLIGVRDWSKWNFKRENEVNEIQAIMIRNAVLNNQNIVISDTNLNKSFREKLVSDLTELGYDVEIKVFHVDFYGAVKRDAIRPNGIGYYNIQKQMKMFNQYLVEQGKYQYKHNPDLPYCWIVDIDGTLAIKNNRSAYDWYKVGNDLPNQHIIDIVKNLKETIFIFSGRDDCCKSITEEWLNKYDIKYNHLEMRKHNDYRKDTIVKEEMFFNLIEGKYNVKSVIDDRPVVVRKWLELGLNVLSVGDPYIEF